VPARIAAVRRTGASSLGIERTPAGPRRVGLRRAATVLFNRPSAWIVLAIVPVGALFSWSRLPTPARDTLWAEDIRNFLGDAVRYGPVPALFRSYAGYLHTVPRTIAGLTVEFVPVSAWANSMAFGACLVTGIVGGLVFIATGTTVRWMPARLFIASVTFLVPLAPREVLGNTANLHWYFLWLAPWLLLYRPGSKAAAWVMAAAALFATLTEIQMALFLPLMLWQRRDRLRVPIRAFYLLGTALQLIATLVAPRGIPSTQPVGLASVAYGYLINCLMTILSPNPAVLGPILISSGPLVGIGMFLLVLAVVAYIVLRGTNLHRVLALTLLFSSLALYAIAVAISPRTFYDYVTMSKVQLASPWLDRYGVVPSMFLLCLIPLACVVWRDRHPRAIVTIGRPAITGAAPARRQAVAVFRGTLAPAIALVVVVAVMLMSFTPAYTRRSHGPEWQSQVARQQALCAQEAAASPVELHGAPSAGWELSLTCAQLGKRE
jgi:hypothetical protein